MVTSKDKGLEKIGKNYHCYDINWYWRICEGNCYLCFFSDSKERSKLSIVAKSETQDSENKDSEIEPGEREPLGILIRKLPIRSSGKWTTDWSFWCIYKKAK